MRESVAVHNREWEQSATFDGRVAAVERLCQQQHDDRSPKPQSKPWYAREILFAIGEVREALDRQDWQRATSQAVVVGALAAQADARHHWPAVRRGLALLQSTQAAGRERGQQVSEQAADVDHRLGQLLKRYQSSDTRPTLRRLARDLQLNERTVRRHLDRLKLQLPVRR